MGMQMFLGCTMLEDPIARPQCNHVWDVADLQVCLLNSGTQVPCFNVTLPSGL